MRDITKELVTTADQIRKKYRALKRGREYMEESRAEILKPVVEPLKELVESQKYPLPMIESAPRLPQSPRMIQSSPRGRFLTLGSIAKHYLSRFLTKSEADNTYGLRFENLAYKIGNKSVEMRDDDFIIDDVKYKGTPGLWELIVLKEPENYTDQDLATYKEILLQTDAHRKGYKPGAQISSNKHSKYTNIIKPLMAKTGQGFLQANENKVDYKYWDDPNEIVDRLRLLYYEKLSGNTNVHNEMESIIEELKEKNIIFPK